MKGNVSKQRDSDVSAGFSSNRLNRSDEIWVVFIVLFIRLSWIQNGFGIEF